MSRTKSFKPETGVMAGAAAARSEGSAALRSVRVCETPAAKPAWQALAEIGATMTEEERAATPPDLSQNLDHYLYGTAKRTDSE